MRKTLMTLIALLFMAINAYGYTKDELDAMDKETDQYCWMLTGENGVTKDTDTALSKLREQAESGNVMAAGILGAAYLGNYNNKGADVEKNPQEAEKWCRIGATSEGWRAVFNLADALWQNEKYSESIEWWRKAAKLNPEIGSKVVIASVYMLKNGFAKTEQEKEELILDIIHYVSVEKEVRPVMLELLDMDFPGMENSEKLKQKYSELTENTYLSECRAFAVGLMEHKGLGVQKYLSYAHYTYIRMNTTLGDAAVAVVYEEGPAGRPVIDAARRYYYKVAEMWPNSDWVKKHIKNLDNKPELANEYLGYPGSRCYWKKNSSGTRDVVDPNGKVIVPCSKYGVVGFEKEVVIVRRNGKVGAINYAGKLVVPTSYTSFEGTGDKGRLVFANKTSTGVRIFIFSKSAVCLPTKRLLPHSPGLPLLFSKISSAYLTSLHISCKI